MSGFKTIERFEKIKSLPVNMTVCCVEFCIDIFNDFDEKEIDKFSEAIKKAWLIGRDIEKILAETNRP